MKAGLDKALSTVPEPVRTRVAAGLDAADGGAAGRALLSGLFVASRAGARPVEVVETSGVGIVRMLDAAERPFVLATMSFAHPAHECGDPRDVARFLPALEGALGPWRFLLHFRRALPPEFDPAEVARAVHLWRMAMDRGDWGGRHAVYEDDGVAIDLAVTDDTEHQGGLIASVPPLPAMDRLSGVYQRVIAALHDLEGMREQPLVFALHAEPAWRLPRGHVFELLYGLLDEMSAERNGDELRFEGVVRPTGVSLFSDPACRDVAALWWLEPGDPGQVRGQCHVNPWCAAGPPPTFPGTSFAPEPGTEDTILRRPTPGPVRMIATGRGLTSWEIAP